MWIAFLGARKSEPDLLSGWKRHAEYSYKLLNSELHALTGYGYIFDSPEIPIARIAVTRCRLPEPITYHVAP